MRQAFTNFVIAKAAKKLADDNLNDFRHELILPRTLKAGDLAKLDFERLDLQLAQFESDESNARSTWSRPAFNSRFCSDTQAAHDFDMVGDVVPPPLCPTP